MIDRSKIIFEELQFRIENELGYFKNSIPERVVIAWRAYLAALFEWGVIDVNVYDKLIKYFPKVEDDPSLSILKGRS